MEKLIVEITDESKSNFVKELLSSFDYLNVREEKDFTDTDNRLISKFALAFDEIETHLNGKKKLKSAREFLS